MTLENIIVNNQQVISVDAEPTLNSNNLIKSGGTYETSYRFNVFNKKEFLDCIKEFYVADSNIDLSTIVCGRLHYGSSHGYGIELCSTTDFTTVVMELRGNLTSNIIRTYGTNHLSYAVIDWDKVAFYCNGAQFKNIYDLTIDNVKPKIQEYWPYIKANLNTIFIEDNVNIIKQSRNFITNSSYVNSCLKELYISDSSIDYSSPGWFRFYCGHSNMWGIEINYSDWSLIARMFIGTTTKPSSLIIANNGGAVIDWDKVLSLAGSKGYIDYQINYVQDVLIKDLNFSPAIKEEVDKNEITFRIGEWDMNISNLKMINECVKELYYDDKEIDLSLYTIFRFYYGSSSAYGISLFKSGYADGLVLWQYFSNVNLNSSLLHGVDNGHSWYAVLNWEKIQTICGSNLYRDISNVSLNPYINYSSCYWPTIHSEIVGNKTDSDYYAHVINVYPDSTNPCQIANLIRSITDASEYNRYKILVHSGTYEETDIATKDYVDIVGENYEDTILVHDGDATYNSPNDYSFAPNLYSNVPVNTIPWKEKHLIFHMSNSTVKNITLKTVGGTCKYICHQDGSGNKFTAVFEHCNFVNSSGSNVLGVGANAGQYFRYIDCQFIENKNLDTERTHSFNLHNQSSGRTEPCGLRFENCNFIHTGWIHISDLGSGQTDYFEFIDCACNNERTFVRFTKVQYDETEPSYSIIIRVIGGNMGGIAPDGGRPDTKLSIQSRFINLIHSANNIPFGTPLYNNALAVNANNGYVFKLSDVDNVYNMKTISTYDVGFGLAVAGNYKYGDNLYINNGKFTKTVNGNIAGTVKQDVELSEDGYVMVQKKI